MNCFHTNSWWKLVEVDSVIWSRFRLGEYGTYGTIKDCCRAFASCLKSRYSNVSIGPNRRYQKVWEAVVGELIAQLIPTPHVQGSRPGGYGTLSNKLLTDYHHTSITKLSVRWCVWNVGGGFPDRVRRKAWKWVVVYSSVTFQING